MSKILKVKARQVFDSRGNPTVEAEVYIKNNSATAICPSGASTGTFEAFEKRDKNNKRYLGKSVLGAISQALGLLSLIAGVIGFVTQLANMILQDLKNLAGAVQRITEAAIAGLLDGLMSDPCLKHLIMAGIAGFGLAQTIKKLT